MAMMYRIIARLTLDAAVVAAALFVGAGTIMWPRAWTMLAVLCAVRGVGAWAVHRVHPAVLRERVSLPMHAAQSLTDRALVLGVLATGFVGIPLLAGLDVWHWQVFVTPPRLVAGAGLLAFALGWALKNVALRANAFAVAEVRLQPERGHTVADVGPYRVVRHPFYAADPLILFGAGLWLGSYAATLATMLPLGLMVIRLRREEQVLGRALPGYVAYMRRVRFRLVPGLW
jgi:protein-S-isoprenylcysteine O-methyltransferase Ste14